MNLAIRVKMKHSAMTHIFSPRLHKKLRNC